MLECSGAARSRGGVFSVLAAEGGVVNAQVTAHSSPELWVAVTVLVVVGGVLSAAVTVKERPSGRVPAARRYPRQRRAADLSVIPTARTYDLARAGAKGECSHASLGCR